MGASPQCSPSLGDLELVPGGVVYCDGSYEVRLDEIIFGGHTSDVMNRVG